MSLLGNLGLDQVDSNPDDLPDGVWAGKVHDSKIITTKKGNVTHMIDYMVTQGEKAGTRKAEWFTHGTPQYDDNGNLVGVTPTMTDNAKSWYKKRLIELGVPENQISSLQVEDLIGREVMFGTKRNGQYVNVSFARLQNPAQQAQSVQQQAPQPEQQPVNNAGFDTSVSPF